MRRLAIQFFLAQDGMRRHIDQTPRPWSPGYLGQGVRWTPCLGVAQPAWQQHPGRPARPQGEHPVERSWPGQHPNFGRLAEFGQSHEVGAPLPTRNTGLRRCCGSEKCQRFAVLGPLKDKGLRKFCGSDQCHRVGETRPTRNTGLRRCCGSEKCQGFEIPVPLRNKGLRSFGGSEQCQRFAGAVFVKDKGLRRSSFPCKSHKFTEFAAIQHQSLRRFRRDFAMERDQTLGPFGHRGHESSNRKMAEVLRTSQDFGVGADQNSHCGWILGKLWDLHRLKFRGEMALPVSLPDSLGHDWSLIEHHREEAAQTLRWMQRIEDFQSCQLQLDRADATQSPSRWVWEYPH